MNQPVEALKPCPHCGAEPTEEAIEPHTHALSIGDWCMPDHGGSHVIECGCGAGMIDDTRAAVVARWNRRALSAPAATAEPARQVAQDAYLCQAWGETDLPCAEVVTDEAGIAAFMVREWLGDKDATDYDGTPTLPSVLAEIAEHDWKEEPVYSIEFEIGGVSVERVYSFFATPAAPSVPAGYALVPVEPTPAMLEAMATAWQQADKDECLWEYRAAIAAAPQPGAPSAQSDARTIEAMWPAGAGLPGNLATVVAEFGRRCVQYGRTGVETVDVAGPLPDGLLLGIDGVQHG